MGIYPSVTWEKVDEFRMLRVTTTPGLTVREVFALQSRVEERTDCFCCSCDDGDPWTARRDVFCRNHGFAGSRPCELHQMPGTADEQGVMPASVQTERARHETRRAI